MEFLDSERVRTSYRSGGFHESGAAKLQFVLSILFYESDSVSPVRAGCAPGRLITGGGCLRRSWLTAVLQGDRGFYRGDRVRAARRSGSYRGRGYGAPSYRAVGAASLGGGRGAEPPPTELSGAALARAAKDHIVVK